MIELNYKKANNLPDALDNLYYIISLLRSPEGCPWDRTQTNKTATISMIDESYEYLDGVVKENLESMREEIGDVLINVFMNLYIHEEKGDFKPEEAVNEVCEKLIRRHAHVFSTKAAKNAEDALLLWNEVKEKVEGHKDKESDFFSHIPTALPPLETSYEILKKLNKIGLAISDKDLILDTILRQINEIRSSNDISEENDHLLGSLLFSVVELCRAYKIRPNVALFSFNQAYKSHYQKGFDLAVNNGITIEENNAKEIQRFLGENAK